MEEPAPEPVFYGLHPAKHHHAEHCRKAINKLTDQADYRSSNAALFGQSRSILSLTRILINISILRHQSQPSDGPSLCTSASAKVSPTVRSAKQSTKVAAATVKSVKRWALPVSAANARAWLNKSFAKRWARCNKVRWQRPMQEILLQPETVIFEEPDLVSGFFMP